MAEDTADSVGYKDSSYIEEAVVGATAEGRIFLGERATMMDVETLGKAGAWEEGYQLVVSDSQVAIRRCINLTSGV